MVSVERPADVQSRLDPGRQLGRGAVSGPISPAQLRNSTSRVDGGENVCESCSRGLYSTAAVLQGLRWSLVQMLI